LKTLNKYVRGLFGSVNGAIKTIWLKIVHGNNVQLPRVSVLSLLSEITVDRGGKLSIGNRFRMRGGSKIRVRKGAKCSIGNNISLNHGCMIVCRESISICDGAQFGPNVLIYDHDHDFRVDGGISAGKYKESPIIIGKNVWIGANSVVLRGTVIGDNCVIGAGCIIKGSVPANSILVQKRFDNINPLNS